jgi:ATP-dependent RNA helicase RhlB
MNMPELIEVTPEVKVADNVTQMLYHLGTHEKPNFLLSYLKREECDKTLIFVNTKRVGNRLKDILDFNGFPTAILSGDVSQEKRLKVLKDFMSGKVKILVGTDVASRGLHIEGVTHVINFDLPQEAEDYVHRIGRTARAGASGVAVSLACEDYVLGLEEIEAYIGNSIPSELPKEEWFVDYKKPPRRPRPPRTDSRPGGRPQRGGANRGRSGGPSNRNSGGKR